MPSITLMSRGSLMARLSKEEFVQLLVADLEKVISDGYWAQEEANEARKKAENAQSLADSYASTEKDMRDQYFYLTGQEYID
jgi:hypothetical protein